MRVRVRERERESKGVRRCEHARNCVTTSEYVARLSVCESGRERKHMESVGEAETP